MNDAFALIHNHFERVVFDAVKAAAHEHPVVASNEEWLADVACVALNRLPPRYIRNAPDFAFYRSWHESEAAERAVHDAVREAFAYVESRVLLGART